MGNHDLEQYVPQKELVTFRGGLYTFGKYNFYPGMPERGLDRPVLRVRGMIKLNNSV